MAYLLDADTVSFLVRRNPKVLERFARAHPSTVAVSIITLMEISGLAAKIISDTYRAVEVLSVAGAIYLAINFALTRLLQFADHRLTPHLRREEVRVVAAAQGAAA